MDSATFASLFLAVLAVGVATGLVARILLGDRIQLSWAELTVAGIVGSGLGGSLTAAVVEDERILDWRVLVGALAGTLLAALAMGGLAARLRPEPVRQRASVPDLLAAGESDDVEYKTSARWNVHTGARDAKLEHIVAKTVAGFANAEGGTLLIGVDDDGQPVGLDEDLRLVKAPDLDRYELWLRDLLGRCLGDASAARVEVDFAVVAGHDVCRLTVPPSPSPVFVDPPKGEHLAEFWLRVGNSTRQLPPDELLEYHATRWGR